MGKRWTVALIKKLWDIAWDLWEHRNGVLHEKDNAVSSAELHRLNRSVSDAFSRLQLLSLPANDWHLLSISLAKLLKKDQLYKETWLRNASMTLQDKCHSQWSRRHAQERLIHGMRIRMKNFLRPPAS
jgi:hypothetical protein